MNQSASEIDDALSSVTGPSRGNEFLSYILETTVPGVHFNVDDDDDEKLLKGVTSAHNRKPGKFRLVDGAREDHMIPGYLKSWQGRDSANAVMKIQQEDSPQGEPSSVRDGEMTFTGVEPGDVLSVRSSHSHYLEFLYRQVPNLLANTLEDKETTCSTLLAMAENVKVLPPADERIPWDILDTSLRKASLCELVKEMKTVEERCGASLMGSSGLFVLTKSPYSAFLRALAADSLQRP